MRQSKSDSAVHPQFALPSPVEDALGIEMGVQNDQSVLTRLRPRPNGLNERGEIAPGVLCVLVDCLLGNAGLTVIPSDKIIVTSSLHMNLVSRPGVADGPITGIGRVGGIIENGVLSQTDLEDRNGCPVAAASARFAILGSDSRGASQVRTPQSSPEDDQALEASVSTESEAILPISSPVLDWLDLRVQESNSTTELRIAMDARSEFRNERGGVHGGIGALLGEQAAQLVLQLNPLASPGLRPVELKATFLRPVETGRGSVECLAELLHLGRNLAVSRAQILSPNGKVAVIVDVMFASVS